MEEIDLDTLRVELSKPLPIEAIKPHPTKSFLSTIKSIYVTERFNECFGLGKWSIKNKVEHIDLETGMVVMHVFFSVPSLGIEYDCFGGNDNGGSKSKNFDLGDAYKGATTDAITKIGSWLGVGSEVFKGQVGKTIQKKNDKKWCNFEDSVWKKAIANNMSLKELMAYYNLSKENQDKYENQLLKQ